MCHGSRAALVSVSVPLLKMVATIGATQSAKRVQAGNIVMLRMQRLIALRTQVGARLVLGFQYLETQRAIMNARCAQMVHFLQYLLERRAKRIERVLQESTSRNLAQHHQISNAHCA